MTTRGWASALIPALGVGLLVGVAVFVLALSGAGWFAFVLLVAAVPHGWLLRACRYTTAQALGAMLLDCVTCFAIVAWAVSSYSS